MAVTLWHAAKEGWRISLQCGRQHAGLKTARPCMGVQPLHLPSLIAAMGPDVAIDSLQKAVRCPRCGTDRFELHITAPPKPAAGAEDAKPPLRRMRPARNGEGTLGTTRETWVVFVCPKCKRRGEHHRDRLIAEFGPDVQMPSLLQIFAAARGCKMAIPYPDKFDLARGNDCQIHYDVAGI